MAWSNLEVRTDVESTILEYGRELLVNKLVAVDADALYQDGPVEYTAGVAVKAHVAYGRLDEKVFSEQFDQSLTYDGSATFAASLLLAALPTFSDVHSALTVRDRLSFDSRSWRIVALHYSGELRGEKMVIIALFEGIKGDAL